MASYSNSHTESEERYTELAMSPAFAKQPSPSAQVSGPSGSRQVQRNASSGCVNNRCLFITLIVVVVVVIIDTSVICFLTADLVNRRSEVGKNDPKVEPLGPSGQQGQQTPPPGSPGPAGPLGQAEPPGLPASQGGAIYTRWGRTVCPRSDVDLIYEGVVGGGHHTHTGSGSNYLCLHKEPQWLNYLDGNQYSKGRALLYGAEYQSTDDIFTEKGLQDNDVPCAVCQTQHRPNVIMIPGRTQCPNSSWILEYRGYLMAEHYGHKGRTMFVCMDEEPETIQGGAENKNGVLFYPTEAICGSLPCPNYVGGREVACVVCSL